MKKFSILKLVCMLLCSFSLFAACAGSGDSGNSNSNGSGSSNDSGTNTGSGTGTGSGSGTGTGGGSDSGSGSGTGTGGSSEDPNDYGIIKDYNPYISPTKRHIIATEYLECGVTYFITESGEVYSSYSSNHNRLNVFDKSNNKVTDEVKIVSGECIKGTFNAILKSKDGKYYITNIKYNTSVELTFYKDNFYVDKSTPYEATDEIKFGNVEVSGYYYVSLKDGVIHYWKTSEESKPIKISGSNFFSKIYIKNDLYAITNYGDIYKLNIDKLEKIVVSGSDISFIQMYVSNDLLYAITEAGDLYILNNDTMKMEKFTEIYYSNQSNFDYSDRYLEKLSNDIKFKAILSNGYLLSTDNNLYEEFYSTRKKIVKLGALNNDSTSEVDFTIDKVYERGTLYRIYSSGTFQYINESVVKGSNGKYYSLSRDSMFFARVKQLNISESFIKEVSNDIYYYDSSYNIMFFKTADGLEVRGINSHGLLGIGRDYKGVIGTTDGERKKVLFPESDGNIDVKKMWMSGSYNSSPIYAYTDKGFYSWGMYSTGADNLAVPAKVKAYKITGFPSGMGTVYGTYDCDLTLTASEASNLNIKDTWGNLFITEDGRVFRKYSGNLYFDKDEWIYSYKCASDGTLANSFVQLDLGEGVVAKGFYGFETVMTNIGILTIDNSYSSYNNNYFNKWAETEGTIVE